MYDSNLKQKKVIAGISVLTICRILFFLSFTIILSLFSSILYAKEAVTFSDSLYTYTVKTGSLKKSVLKRYLKNLLKENQKEALYYFLDSLGYFHPYTDTIAQDTIVIDIGNQSVIDTVIVQCAYQFVLDSISRMRFPISYNAGTIQSFAHQTLNFLAQRGFPFAKVSIAISDTVSPESLSDTTDKVKPGKHLIIRFIIDIQKGCVFDRPLFSGEFKTKEKILGQDIVFRKGQDFDIRKVETSQKRLVSRPYIANVQVASPGIVITSKISDTTDTSADETATFINSVADSIDSVAVPFFIEDNSGMGIDGAVAYQSEGGSRWSGLLSITLLNILHRGEAASLYYRGEETLQLFELEISIPFPFMWPFFCSASFGLEIEEKNYGFLHGEFEVLTQLKGLWQAGIAINGHETTTNEKESSWYFLGIDLILQRQREQYRDRVLSREFNLRTGTGVADRAHGKFSRWRFDFSAGSHIPLFKRQAFLGKIATKAITTDERDSLHQTEKIRIGGHKNIRGYAENQYPFKAVAYAQTEYLFYFNPTGSIYIFMDGGVGFPDELSLSKSDREELFGYGVGIRVPVKFGSLSLEWARNYKERKGLGRIHVRIRNSLSSGI